MTILDKTIQFLLWKFKKFFKKSKLLQFSPLIKKNKFRKSKSSLPIFSRRQNPFQNVFPELTYEFLDLRRFALRFVLCHLVLVVLPIYRISLLDYRVLFFLCGYCNLLLFPWGGLQLLLDSLFPFGLPYLECRGGLGFSERGKLGLR